MASSTKSSWISWRLLNNFLFYRVGLLALRPTPIPEDQASVFISPRGRVATHFSRLLRHAWVTEAVLVTNKEVNLEVNNSMEVCTSWEIGSLAARQEIHRFLWNLKIRYRVHKSPPLVAGLSQMYPVHNFSPSFRRIYSNIIPADAKVFQVVSSLQVFRPKFCMNFSSLRAVIAQSI
jgi:hypothetical protein